MTESIPTTWNDDRDEPFFGIAEALRADAHLTARIETVLQDLTAAGSWETMAARSVERAQRPERVPVPVPVPAPRRPRP